jgi:hypothetical protein
MKLSDRSPFVVGSGKKRRQRKTESCKITGSKYAVAARAPSRILREKLVEDLGDSEFQVATVGERTDVHENYSCSVQKIR